MEEEDEYDYDIYDEESDSGPPPSAGSPGGTRPPPPGNPGISVPPGMLSGVVPGTSDPKEETPTTAASSEADL